MLATVVLPIFMPSLHRTGIKAGEGEKENIGIIVQVHSANLIKNPASI